MAVKIRFSNIINLKCICLILLLTFIFPGKLFPQQGLPFTKYFPSSVYNAGMQNSAIDQDSRGFMYFANNFGLLEFDGRAWQLYTVSDGSKVRDVANSRDGKIYIAAQGEFGFFRVNSIGGLTYVSLSDSLAPEEKDFDEVWKVFVNNEKVYYCTTKKIFCYQDNKLVRVVAIRPSLFFFFIHEKLYFQDATAALNVLNSASVEPAINASDIKDIAIISILPSKENNFLLVSSDQGLFNSTLSNNYLSKKWLAEMGSSKINCAVRLSSGNLAFGTQNDGLYIYSEDGHLMTHLSKGVGLNDRAILSIKEDLLGNLWVGHNNGIAVVELASPFSYINEQVGLPGSGYDAFAFGDYIYLATNNGLYRSNLQNDKLKFIEVKGSIGQAYYINNYDGTILLGHHTGSFKLTDDRAISLNNAVGSWTFVKSRNALIAGTYTGLQLFTKSGNSWRYQKDIVGFNESSRVMEIDEFGDVWMTHGYKGVYRISLNQNQDSVTHVSFYGTQDGLPSQTLINVFKIQGKLLFATPNGIYNFSYAENKFIKDHRFAAFAVLNEPINVLADDANQNIFFLGQNQMGIMEHQPDGSYIPNVDIFNKVHMLLNDDLENISVINSNTILFGAEEGFIIYSPSKKMINNHKFRAFIRHVSIGAGMDSVIFAGNFLDNGKQVNDQPMQDVRALKYEDNSIKLTCSTDFMNDFENIVYQYWLDGYDREWGRWEFNAYKEYTNLNEGEYTFHVRAKNIYNQISGETTYTFIILPPWYRSKVAYAGYSGFFGVLFLIGFIYVDRRFEGKKRLIEEKKQKEIDEIGSKLKSVTRSSAEKIERLETEKLQTEIDLKNVELASSTMNLINKNEFISSIKNNLVSISKKSKSPEVRSELGKLTNEIAKNIANDEDWNNFTFHFNQVHGDFTTRLTTKYEHLSAQDLRLCSYLRLNLSTKEIAQLLNISVRGVEISRYRLRKKLNLQRSDNLSEFILSF